MRGSSIDASEWWEEKIRAIRSGRPPSIQLFLRSLAPPVGVKEQQERVLERLRTFEQRGLVESIDITVWGDAVCPDGCCAETPAGQNILDRTRELQHWATETPGVVDTTFEEKQVSSSITNETFRKIVPPRVTVGVYEGGEVSLVLPCQVDGETVGVDDFLKAFGRHAPVENGIGTSA